MDQYAVIGHPVAHSLSPQIHQQFAEQTKQQLTYCKIEAPLDQFVQTVREFQGKGGKGASVTLPFKIEAFELADEHSALAKSAGAANTLMFRDDGSIFADNTDGTGLIQDLTRNHNYSLRQKRVLVIGAGGASRNILCCLLEQAPSELILANRTVSKAQTLAEQYAMHGHITAVALDAIPEAPFDLIINASSAGLTSPFPSLPLSLVGQHTWCYDLIYKKERTAFLRWAEPAEPKQLLDGLGMLVEQAAAAFYLWRGVYPQTKPVIAALLPF